MQKTKKNENLLPYEVIIAGSQRDIDAINTIVAHYRPYVLKLSLRKEGDRYCVDEELRNRLEAALIAKTLDFKVCNI